LVFELIYEPFACKVNLVVNFLRPSTSKPKAVALETFWKENKLAPPDHSLKILSIGFSKFL
jgi:hypothetical protein